MKTFLSNWREVLIGIVALLIVTALLSLMGSEAVAANPTLNLIVTGVTQIAMGGLKCVSAVGLAWYLIAVTFPEANKFIVGSAFDDWWKSLNSSEQARISLIAVAVLAVVAGLCMAS